MAIRAGAQYQLVVIWIELDAPDPMRMIFSSDQRFHRLPKVPESKTAVIAACDQVILFVGIEIQSSDNVVTEVLDPPDLLHVPRVPCSQNVLVHCCITLAILVRIPSSNGKIGVTFAFQTP